MFREINAEEISDLLELVYEMYVNIYGNTTMKEAASQLVGEMSNKGFAAYGTYKNDKLVGFITGYSIGKDTFFVSGVYCSVPYRVKKFIDWVESELKSCGYTRWETQAYKTINSIAPKLGANIKLTIYEKEI